MFSKKQTGISMGFFHILHEVYIYKQKLVVVEIPEWKLKTKVVIGKMFGSCLPPIPKIFFKFSGIFRAEGRWFFKFPVVNLFNNSF